MRPADKVMRQLKKVRGLPDGKLESVKFVLRDGDSLLITTKDKHYLVFLDSHASRGVDGVVGEKYSVGALHANRLLRKARVTLENEYEDFKMWWGEQEQAMRRESDIDRLRRLAKDLKMESVSAEIERVLARTDDR